MEGPSQDINAAWTVPWPDPANDVSDTVGTHITEAESLHFFDDPAGYRILLG